MYSTAARSAEITFSSAASSALLTDPIYLGTATAARTPRMTVTIINSIFINDNEWELSIKEKRSFSFYQILFPFWYE